MKASYEWHSPLPRCPTSCRPPLPSPLAQVAAWDAPFYESHPLLSALHGLFSQLAEQEAQRQGGASGGSLPPVDPSALREALAQLPGQQFRVGECARSVRVSAGLLAAHRCLRGAAVCRRRRRSCRPAAPTLRASPLPANPPLSCGPPPAPPAGEMNDAAEVLLSVYDKVMEVAAGLDRLAGVDATFGLAVEESVHCRVCGKDSLQTSYTQYFYNTQASACTERCMQQRPSQ